MRRVFFFFSSLFLLTGHALAAGAEYNVNQKPYNAIGAEAAYNLGFTGSGATVAVVDNGTRTTHRELKEQISNLQTDEYNKPEANTDHGTPVAGIIAGKKDGQGMHGIAYDAKILAFSVNLDDGVDCPTCYQSSVDAWQILADDTFNFVKIVNNSIGSYTYLPNSDPGMSSQVSALSALAAKDKLIVASAGNDANLSPANSPAGSPYFSTALKNNVISAIAYNPNYSPSSPYFIERYTNLAKYAQAWSLAAPVGRIYAPSNTNDTSYDENFAGTSAAAPVISGSAAVVLSAFPYMGGKQLADVLFSTADKNYADFSNYMVQKDNSKNQFLFFGTEDGYGKNWTDAEKLAVVQSELGGGYTCDSETVVCADVSYADVFGQGLLNLGKAVRGPGYFDANRLDNADFDGTQFLYSVDTQGYDSTWSNNIGQVKKDGSDTNVGLKKSGDGVLTLTGNNTYLGKTVITGGTLRLKGSLAGNVSVSSGGIFYVNGGTVSEVSSAASGKITMDDGTVGLLTNAGETTQSGGTLLTVANSGSFYLLGNGRISNSLTNTGQFYLNSGSLPDTVVNSGNFYLNGGQLSETIQNTGTVQNNGVLKTGRVVGGTLINSESGTFYPLSTPETFVNYGSIALLPAVGNPSEMQQINASYVNLISGGFVLDPKNLPILKKDYLYRVITASNVLTVGEYFQLSNKIGDYISSQTVVDTTEKTVSLLMDFHSLSSEVNSPLLTSSERQMVAIIDRLFMEDGLDLAGYYFLNQDGLKKQINKMKDQIRPTRFASLPLSDKLMRGVYTHVFERQRLKDPLRYEGRMDYYSPSSRSRPPRGDVYRRFRPDNAPRENYHYNTPQPRDVYRQYRPDNAPREEYRHYVPQKRDVYRAFRPGGRSGGQSYGLRKQAWGQMLMHQGTLKADGASGSTDADNTGMGVMFGWDFVYSNDFLWGLTAGYSASSVKQGADRTDIADWRLGAYFSRQKDFISIDGALMIGRQSYDKTRETVLPNVSLKSKASFGGSSIEAALNVGYDIQQLPMQGGDWSLRPYIGLTVAQMTQDAYKEKGDSDVNLSVDQVKDTSVTLSPGLIGGFVVDEMNIFMFQPEYVFFDIRYDMLLSGGSPKTKAYFSADSLQTSFDSLDSKEDSAFSIGIGVNGRLTPQTRMNLLLNQRNGSKSSGKTISVSIIHSF